MSQQRDLRAQLRHSRCRTTCCSHHQVTCAREADKFTWCSWKSLYTLNKEGNETLYCVKTSPACFKWLRG